MIEEAVPLPFLSNISQANNFFECHLCLMESPYAFGLSETNGKAR